MVRALPSLATATISAFRGDQQQGGPRGANVPASRGPDFRKLSPEGPGSKAENPLRSCSWKSGPAREGKGERRRLCAQRLKFDKVCSDQKPEQNVCACVFGVPGSGEGGGSERQSGDSAGGKDFLPSLPAPRRASCGAPTRDQAVLVAGSSVAVPGHESEVPLAGPG